MLKINQISLPPCINKWWISSKLLFSVQRQEDDIGLPSWSSGLLGRIYHYGEWSWKEPGISECLSFIFLAGEEFVLRCLAARFTLSCILVDTQTGAVQGKIQGKNNFFGKLGMKGQLQYNIDITLTLRPNLYLWCPWSPFWGAIW